MSVNWSNANLARLRRKIQENPKEFVVIVGAGVSTGLPSWADLKNKMLNILKQKFNEESPDKLPLIDQLLNLTDYWDAFEQIKEELGCDYERIMMEQLSTKDIPTPPSYINLWKLGISGMITFNIDKFAEQSCVLATQSSPDLASGLDVYKYKTFTNTDDLFVWHPHGEYQSPSSWVFTRSERDKLYRNVDFKKTMSTLLNSKNLLIVGFNSLEYSFQSILNDIGFDGRVIGYHNYIISDNHNPLDIKRLGKRGFSVIPYSPDKSHHPEVNEIFLHLLKTTPENLYYSSVSSGSKYTTKDIPVPQHMFDYGCDHLRTILNDVVAGIIPSDHSPSEQQLQKLERFYTDYNIQLHNAWMIDPKNQETNLLHGYIIKQKIGRGAFGNVYEAYDDQNNKYAIKVLLQEVKDKFPYLNCFRRGIRSMRILKEHNLKEMVTIHNAYEVPACIVMDYIEGPTLREAIDQRMLSELYQKLDLIVQICESINTAHQLPEQILHRDLKPENIILENFYFHSNEPISIKILDFDLSWHQGSTELTIKIGAMSQGFMAPEQADESQHDYTRTTAVDVYSIGMLIYYILTEGNPAPNQHMFEHFQEDLENALIRKYPTLKWKSIIHHLSQLIIKATYQEQQKRIALSVLLEQIRIVQDACINDSISCIHPLFLQEIALRLNEDNNIQNFDYGRKITLENKALAKKVSLMLEQSGYNTVLRVKIEKTVISSDNRSNLGKYLSSAKDRAASSIDRKLFRFKGDVKQGAIQVELIADLPELVNLHRIEEYTQSILNARAALDLK